MTNRHRIVSCTPCRRGTVLVLVMWISLGLVSIALYFGTSMMFEYRAADNSAAALEADHAIAGALRYMNLIIADMEDPGMLPDMETYVYEDVPIDDATFWFIGRGDSYDATGGPVFGLTDEASKLNLNTATQEMLELLPNMPADFAAAIIDWRDEDADVTPGGAESETYLLQDPSYMCKDAPFESVEELRLVLGAEWDVLYGEDVNRNGILDPNEDDGEETWPDDNQDGILDPGLVEYLTVHSRESNIASDGTDRSEVDGTSVLEWYLNEDGMTPDQFVLKEDYITTRDEQFISGLVNVSTASAAVLACIPGIGVEYADELVAYRQGKEPYELSSVVWILEVLDEPAAIEAGPYITAKSYQLTADVAALGHMGRGFRRTRFIFDLAGDDPAVVSRRDLTRFGWPLGEEIREQYFNINANERDINERF